MLEATRQEIAILRQVMGHPYISKYLELFCLLQKLFLFLLIYYYKQ